MRGRITSDRLRTMKDLLREQEWIQERIERQRQLLSRDRERVEEVLSPDYWLRMLAMRAAGIVENVTERLVGRLRGR